MRHAPLPLILVLAACQVEPVASPQPSDCGADAYQSLVGAQLAAVTLPADLNARIIGPDTAITMDFRPDRLNIEVEESGWIMAVYCG